MFSYSFHIRDYLTKTRHLSPLEDLAYRRCLDTYYTEESPLPADPMRVARLIALPEYQAEVELVLNEFFVLTEDGWRNDRADHEIAAYRDRAEIARQNGRSGGRPKKTKSVVAENPPGTQSEPAGNPVETNSQANQEPSNPNLNLTQAGKTRANKAPVDLGLFDQFWKAYPRKVAKPEAMKAFVRIKPDAELMQQIMSALERAKASRDWQKDDGQFIPYPSTWLNQARWEDELATEGNGAAAEDWL